jgi:DNA uptake protein ComE-like DNA-binding protein
MKPLVRLAVGLALMAALFATTQHAIPQPPVAAPLDLNTATLEQLKTLPGMGVVYARRVIAGRPYTAKNQLVTRGILPRETYEKLQALVVAHRPKIK